MQINEYKELLDFLTIKNPSPKEINKTNYKLFNEFLFQKGIVKALPKDFVDNPLYEAIIHLYFLRENGLQIVAEVHVTVFRPGIGDEWMDGGIFKMPLSELNGHFKKFIELNQEKGEIE